MTNSPRSWQKLHHSARLASLGCSQARRRPGSLESKKANAAGKGRKKQQREGGGRRDRRSREKGRKKGEKYRFDAMRCDSIVAVRLFGLLLLMGKLENGLGASLGCAWAAFGFCRSLALYMYIYILLYKQRVSLGFFFFKIPLFFCFFFNLAAVFLVCRRKSK